jgi:hypothetical protein
MLIQIPDEKVALSHAKYKRLLNARPAGKALAQNANKPHND